MGRLQAAIFDCDGLLVETEPVWRRIEVEVLGRYGVPLTEEMCLDTTGLRSRELVEYWRDRYPWDEPDAATVERELLDACEVAIETGATVKSGVREAIESCRRRGLRLAVASSSPYRIIRAGLCPHGLLDAFEVVHSAEGEALGKPHPAVYLTAARKLGVEPERCVAIEDSLNGARAAKAAGMLCVAVPGVPGPPPEAFDMADLVLPSLLALDDEAWARLDGRRPRA